MTDAKHDSVIQDAMNVASTSIPSPNASDQLTAQDQLNFASRWLENGRFLGGLSQAALLASQKDHVDLSDSTEVNYEIQMGGVIGNSSGFLMGLILHWLVKGKYQKKKSYNPLYRNFKTLASFGFSVGMAVAKTLPISSSAQNFVGAILADISSLVCGLFAIPYWLFRQYVLKTPEAKRNLYARTGKEGWSKYGKTCLVYGASLGQVAGAIYSQVKRTNIMASMAIGSGIASIGSFLLGITLIPLINKLCSKILVSDSKDSFRNNYIRSGMTLGTAIGSAVGFLLGTVLLPGLGSTAGMLLGAAIGSMVGGVTLGVSGRRISQSVNTKWKISDDTDNSWDYATRSTSFLCAFLGSAIGFFLPIPGGALVGAALGGAIAGAIGWAAGFGVIHTARKINPIEPKSTTLPWTQRMASGSGIGSLIGSVLGFVLGMAGGPLGAIAGAALGGAIGGFIGGVCGVLYEKKARRSLSQVFVKSKVSQNPLPEENKKISITNPLSQRFNSENKSEAIPIENTRPRNPVLQNPLLSNNSSTLFGIRERALTLEYNNSDESPEFSYARRKSI